MTQQTRTFVIADPRTFDGDPFEVAERATAQAEALAALLVEAIQDAYVMARNAEMERQIIADGTPDAAKFEQGAHGRKFEHARNTVGEARADLALLRKSAGFNPKAPLGS